MVLLCGSTAWTLTQSLDKKLDGAYTKVLSVLKNVTWQKHITNGVLHTGYLGSRPQSEREAPLVQRSLLEE